VGVDDSPNPGAEGERGQDRCVDARENTEAAKAQARPRRHGRQKRRGASINCYDIKELSSPIVAQCGWPPPAVRAVHPSVGEKAA
jgi:hypothetical protein